MKKTIVILTVILLLASAKYCFAQTLFQDDFTTADSLDNWSITTGQWRIENGKFYGIGQGGNVDAYAYAGDDSWTNYDFEFKADLLEKHAMVVFRSTGHLTNEYRVQFWAESLEGMDYYKNTYQLTRWKDGTWVDLSNGHIKSPESITDTMVGKVSVLDNNIKVFVNGNKIFEYKDSDPLLNGKIGVASIWTKQTSFDDVLVVTPEPTSMILYGLGGVPLAAHFLRRRRKETV